MPKGGFGNLIALPLQKNARDKNHSLFLDGDMNPYIDQWAFLTSIKRLDEKKLDFIIQNAIQHDELSPVVYDSVEADDEAKPWQRKSTILPDITEPIPQLDGLLAILEHYKIKPELQNKQNQELKIDVRFDGELRDEQKEAFQKLMVNQTGILSASTAFGKTVVALRLIAERKVLIYRALILCFWFFHFHGREC